MSKQIHLSIVFKLPIQIKEDEVGYVSSCPALDVWSQGNTKKEAEKNIKEAVSLFIISCFERGTLDQVLKECGFNPSHSTKRIKAQKPNGTRTVEVQIPFNVSNRSNPEPCHA